MTIWGHIKTFVIVSVVAALIWVFAEAESLRTRSMQVHISLASGEREQFLQMADGNLDSTVQVEIEGSAIAIDEAEATLRKVISVSPGMVGLSPVPGDQVVDLREVLKQHPDLKDLSITVKRVEPSTVRVTVDDLIIREVPVEVVAPFTGNVGTLIARPSKVSLKVRATDAAAIPSGMVAIAQLDRAAFERLVRTEQNPKPDPVLGVRLVLPLYLQHLKTPKFEPALVDVLSQ
jgi:hypothetical protein